MNNNPLLSNPLLALASQVVDDGNRLVQVLSQVADVVKSSGVHCWATPGRTPQAYCDAMGTHAAAAFAMHAKMRELLALAAASGITLSPSLALPDAVVNAIGAATITPHQDGTVTIA